MNKLKDKVAVITGAAEGMGEGIARVYAKYGAEVALVDTNESVLAVAEDLAKQGIHAKAYLYDVTVLSDMEKMVTEVFRDFKKIDLLVCAAMLSGIEPFLANQSKSIKSRILSVNLDGTWNAVHTVLPYIEKEGSGAVVIISSATGFLVADIGTTAYSTSKAALVGLTKALAVEFASKNIRVNCICQGYIHSPIVDRGAAQVNPENPQSVIDSIAESVPLKRLGTSEEIGEVAAFLASKESSYITGAQIVVDGGNGLPETNIIGF